VKAHKEVICTVCGREKRTDPAPIPAIERYLGPHISEVRRIARKDKLPVFFISGEVGLVAMEEKVPYYDHFLAEDEVEDVVGLVEQQLKDYEVERITFFTTRSEIWEPYRKLLRLACEPLGVTLLVDIVAD
jgi:hypothetical protein